MKKRSAGISSAFAVVAASLLAPAGNAQVPSGPPTWEAHALPFQCGGAAQVQTTDLYGFGSCQPALDAAQGQVEGYLGACNGRTVTRDCAPFATPNNFLCLAGKASGGGRWHPTDSPVNPVSGAGCFVTEATAHCAGGSVSTEESELVVTCLRTT